MARLTKQNKAELKAIVLAQSPEYKQVLKAFETVSVHGESIAKILCFGSVEEADKQVANVKKYMETCEKNKEYPLIHSWLYVPEFSDSKVFYDLAFRKGDTNWVYVAFNDLKVKVNECALDDATVQYRKTEESEDKKRLASQLYSSTCHMYKWATPCAFNKSFRENILGISDSDVYDILIKQYPEIIDLINAGKAFDKLNEALENVFESVNTDTRLLELLPVLKDYVALPLTAPTTALVNTADLNYLNSSLSK